MSRSGHVYEDLTRQEEEALKEESRERCRTDLHYLAKHVLGYSRITEHYHQDMARDIDTPKYRFKLLLHPRGHFKSTLGTESFGIKKALENPNARILITNAKLDNSRKFLRAIAHHFQSNSRLRWIWRDWWINQYASDFDRMDMGEKLDWITRDVQDELTLLRPHAGREATFTTGAVDASMVSQHYSLIIGDDLINREFVRTQEMVDKSILYFRDVLDLLDPDGTLLLIGTKWAHLDLYSWIIEEFGHKATFSVPEHLGKGTLSEVVARSEKSKDKKEWYVSIMPTTIEDPIFPEEFSPKVLQNLLDIKGPYEFGAQYMLDPTPAEHQKFHEDWFNPLDVTPDNWLKTLDICITVDPAVSLENKACDSAIAVCGYDRNNRMYFLDGINEQLAEDDLVEALFDLVRKWQRKGRFLHPVGFETIGFQQLYVYNINRKMMETGVFFAIEETKHRSMSKTERILRLVPRIKQGFYMPRKMEKHPYSKKGEPYDLAKNLKWQLLKFPFAGKDDLADALADQLDIVQPTRLPDSRIEYIPEDKREFIHPSIKEDQGHVRKHRRGNGSYNDAVR